MLNFDSKIHCRREHEIGALLELKPNDRTVYSTSNLKFDSKFYRRLRIGTL